VRDGVVYFAAGRSSFLDGGIVVCGVDLNSGKSLYRRVLRGPWPNIKEDTGTPFAMEGALPDLLVSDGTDLYMMRHKFDPTLEKVPTTQESSLGELDMGKPHLVATGGFLDDTGFDRLYWMFSRRWPGFYFSQHAPKAGQLVVFDDATTYSVKYFYRRHLWSPLFVPQEMGYLLFADDNENEPVLQEEDDDKIGGLRWLPEGAYSDEHRRGGRGKEKGTGYIREKPCRWQKMVPLRVRAMLAAGDHLLCAGLPDVVDSDDPTAALKGKKGAQLQAFSKETGELLFTRELSSPPVFDGLSAAQGRLYLATADGKLLCFQG